MSCGVGRRHGLDPALLWLRCRPVATAPIRPLAWNPPYAAEASLEKAKTKTKNKKKERKKCQVLDHVTHWLGGWALLPATTVVPGTLLHVSLPPFLTSLRRLVGMIKRGDPQSEWPSAQFRGDIRPGRRYLAKVGWGGVRRLVFATSLAGTRIASQLCIFFFFPFFLPRTLLLSRKANAQLSPRGLRTI